METFSLPCHHLAIHLHTMGVSLLSFWNPLHVAYFMDMAFAKKPQHSLTKWLYSLQHRSSVLVRPQINRDLHSTASNVVDFTRPLVKNLSKVDRSPESQVSQNQTNSDHDQASAKCHSSTSAASSHFSKFIHQSHQVLQISNVICNPSLHSSHPV